MAVLERGGTMYCSSASSKAVSDVRRHYSQASREMRQSIILPEGGRLEQHLPAFHQSRTMCTFVHSEMQLHVRMRLIGE